MKDGNIQQSDEAEVVPYYDSWPKEYDDENHKLYNLYNCTRNSSWSDR